MPRKKVNNPNTYFKIFPVNLRNLMKMTNTTQQMLGEAIGKTRQSVGYYAEGSSSPDWETLAKIARYFNVSADYLLGISGSISTDEGTRRIVDQTGLSDEAIASLRTAKYLDESDTAELMNLFATHARTPMLARLVAVYQNIQNSSDVTIDAAEFGPDLDNISIGRKDFFKYMLTEYFFSIIQK